MKAVDSSWLVALFDLDDAFHEQAVADLASAERLGIPAAILAESLQAIRYKASKAMGAAKADDISRDVFRQVQDSGAFTILSEGAFPAASRIFRDHPKLSLFDAIAVASARANGLDLLSFDKDQLAAM